MSGVPAVCGVSHSRWCDGDQYVPGLQAGTMTAEQTMQLGQLQLDVERLSFMVEKMYAMYYHKAPKRRIFSTDFETHVESDYASFSGEQNLPLLESGKTERASCEGRLGAS